MSREGARHELPHLPHPQGRRLQEGHRHRGLRRGAPGRPWGGGGGGRTQSRVQHGACVGRVCDVAWLPGMWPRPAGLALHFRLCRLPCPQPGSSPVCMAPVADPSASTRAPTRRSSRTPTRRSRRRLLASPQSSGCCSVARPSRTTCQVSPSTPIPPSPHVRQPCSCGSQPFVPPPPPGALHV